MIMLSCRKATTCNLQQLIKFLSWRLENHRLLRERYSVYSRWPLTSRYARSQMFIIEHKPGIICPALPFDSLRVSRLLQAARCSRQQQNQVAADARFTQSSDAAATNRHRL